MWVGAVDGGSIMEARNFPAIRARRLAWNKGRIVGQKKTTEAQTRPGAQGSAGTGRKRL